MQVIDLPAAVTLHLMFPPGCCGRWRDTETMQMTIMIITVTFLISSSIALDCERYMGSNYGDATTIRTCSYGYRSCRMIEHRRPRSPHGSPLSFTLSTSVAIPNQRNCQTTRERRRTLDRIFDMVTHRN